MDSGRPNQVRVGGVWCGDCRGTLEVPDQLTWVFHRKGFLLVQSCINSRIASG